MLDKANTGSKLWADSAYRSKRNGACLSENGYVSDSHHKKPKGRPMSKTTARANNRRSKVRSAVEHVFARQKGPMSLFIRTIGANRARTKIGIANLVYNMQRLTWHQRQRAPA